MNNLEFIKIIENAFSEYLVSGARSNKKLILLHGSIAEDLSKKLGSDYKIKSLGFEDGKEASVSGRYMDKKVDITVLKDKEPIAGIALKFVMSNYSQNSNNYFENMLGETANIRTNGKPYFQIIILPKNVPYFNKDGIISKMETISEHNLDKYIKLSDDNTEIYMHTPTKTLLYLVDIPLFNGKKVETREEYKKYYTDLKGFSVTLCKEKYDFKSSIVYNDYENFIDKIQHYIRSI